MKHRTRIVAALVVVCGTLLGPAAGATPRSDAAPHIDDLLRVDALGYDCIAERDLERAFRAAGKPFHLPRTCLPAPCARQLSRADLAQVLGRPADLAIWDDYVARYAQTCVHEALWPGEARDTASGIASDAVAFWAPLQPAVGATEASLGDAGGRIATAGGSVAIAQAAAQAALAVPPRAPDGGSPPTRPGGDAISPVPLPPALLFLLSGLLGFGLVRRLS